MKTVIKILYFFYFAGIIILPLFYWPNALIPYEIPKVNIFNRWVEILGLLTILSIPYLPKKKFRYTLFLLVLAFFLISFLSSVYGLDFDKSFLGNPFRSDGLFTLWHLLVLFFITAFILHKKIISRLFFCIFLSSSIISFLTLFDAFSLYVLKIDSVYNFYGVVAPSFGNPNFLAGYLSVTLPFSALYALKKQKCNNFSRMAFAMQFIAIILTRSWAGITILILFLILWTFFNNKPDKKKLWFIIFLIGTLLFIFFLYFLNQKSISDKYRGYMPEGRVRIITRALLAFKEKPILGWGWANFDYAFSSIDWPMQYQNDIYVDKAHSTLLEVVVCTGIFGAIIYLSLITKTAHILYKNRGATQTIIFISFILFVLHSQTNVISISEETVFWILCGIAATYPPDTV